MLVEANALQRHVRRLRALGHESRLSIVRRLVQGPMEGMPVGEIQAALGIPPSTLSHHLAELAHAGLVRSTRHGKVLKYAVSFEDLRDLTGYLWEDCCGSGCRDPHCLTIPPVPGIPMSLGKESSHE